MTWTHYNHPIIRKHKLRAPINNMLQWKDGMSVDFFKKDRTFQVRNEYIYLYIYGHV